jgi:hypothetical protein
MPLQKKARELFESFMQEHYVPRSNKTTASPPCGWLDDAPEGDGFVGT